MREVRITSGATVERVTHVRAPGSDVRFTLMSSAMNLRAFDEMFRHTGSLARWTTAPRVIVQSRVLKFEGVNGADYPATAAEMSTPEVSALLGDLNWGLPQLTGGTFTGFAGEDRELAYVNERVSVIRNGAIVVARYEGLTAATGYWGYARWGISASGEVQSGIVMIDKDFDTSGSPYRRSLRVHELGHALGYNHVTARDSVMNSHARFEPNNADRDAARFAFLRPPLNRSPDLDPDPFSVNMRSSTELVWRGDR